MKKILSIPLVTMVSLACIVAGCGKSKEIVTDDVDSAASVSSISLLNIKGEVKSQIEALAKQYQAETGIEVKVLGIETGADVQATLKGYYLADQMPDIISCEIIEPTKDIIYFYTENELPKDKDSLLSYNPEFIWFNTDKISVETVLTPV